MYRYQYLATSPCISALVNNEKTKKYFANKSKTVVKKWIKDRSSK